MGATSSCHDKCTACSDYYSEASRIPKLLPCFHTFCQPCLQNLQKGISIECPTCHQIHYVKHDGVPSLQTNFYILKAPHASSMTVSQTTGPATAEQTNTSTPKDLCWCTQCEMTAKTSCFILDHEMGDLSNVDVSEMAETHLKVYLVKCKKRFNEALRKHQEVKSFLTSVQHSLHILENQVDASLDENQSRIEQLQESLTCQQSGTTQEISELVSTGQQIKRSGDEVKRLLDKYIGNDLMVKAQRSANAADTLKRPFDRMHHLAATVTVIDTANQQQSALSLPVFQSTALGFRSTAEVELESHLVTGLSYLIFCAAYGSQFQGYLDGAVPKFVPDNGADVGTPTPDASSRPKGDRQKPDAKESVPANSVTKFHYPKKK